MLRIHIRCHKCGSIADQHQERLFATFIDGSNLIQVDDAGVLQTSHKIVILSEAPHRFIAWYIAGRGVEEPRGALILLMPLAPFQPPKPAPGGPATVQRFGTDLRMEDDYRA